MQTNILHSIRYIANRDEFRSKWSTHLSEACSDVRNEDTPMRKQKAWRKADALSPRKLNRKAVTYHHWCRKP
eukprot:158766-Pelagomonas_calceolata.AAC.1